jgi:acyl-CoA thioester hydrolase
MTETIIDVRYPDCDQMAIVHHAVYPIWYEMGRMDFFEECGFGYAKSKSLGIDPAMVNLELNYGQPVRFPQTIRLRTRCVLLQGKKLGFRYEVLPMDGDKPLATAKSFHIWVKDGSSVNIETDAPEMFAAYKAKLETEE